MQPAVGGADIAGDSARRSDVRLFEMNVVGDQKVARANGGGAGGIVQLRTSDVRTARGVPANGVAKTFKLAAANIFELNAIGARRGGSVEVDGDAVTVPDMQAGLSRQQGALRYRGSTDRNEWDDVGRPDSRMDAVLQG